MALQKLYCTKPRAAGATLWGLYGRFHRDSDLPVVAVRSGRGSRVQRVCGVTGQLAVDGPPPENANIGAHEGITDPASMLCKIRFS